LNRYEFVNSDPINSIDYLGLVSPVTVTVKKCEILILFGHGSDKTPHTFKFKDGCSGGHFVGCHNKLTNDQIPEENRIPNAPSTDDVLNNGPGSNSDPDTDYQKYFNDTWDAAIKQASEICKKEQCNCKSINVHSQMVGSGWDPDNWGEPNLTKQQTVSCEGAK